MRRSIQTVTFLTVLVVSTALEGGATSLWSNSSPANRFFMGGNASRVGDILTIEIEESALATEVADAENKRQTSIFGAIKGVFNFGFDKGLFGTTDGTTIDYPTAGFDGTNDYKGESEVERRGVFQANVAATVVMVDDNGNFLIEARKTIKVGKESKSIILSGKIRPKDISAENTVLSSRVADAQIGYEGGGPITSAAEPGVFNKLLRFFF